MLPHCLHEAAISLKVSQHELTPVQDSSYQELATFLDAVESHGTGVLSSIEGGKQQTASEEARLFKKASLRLRQ